jgi:hypothetical protein
VHKSRRLCRRSVAPLHQNLEDATFRHVAPIEGSPLSPPKLSSPFHSCLPFYASLGPQRRVVPSVLDVVRNMANNSSRSAKLRRPVALKNAREPPAGPSQDGPDHGAQVSIAGSRLICFARVHSGIRLYSTRWTGSHGDGEKVALSHPSGFCAERISMRFSNLSEPLSSDRSGMYTVFT